MMSAAAVRRGAAPPRAAAPLSAAAHRESLPIAYDEPDAAMAELRFPARRAGPPGPLAPLGTLLPQPVLVLLRDADSTPLSVLARVSTADRDARRVVGLRIDWVAERRSWEEEVEVKTMVDDHLSALHRELFDYGIANGMAGFENDFLNYNLLAVPHFRTSFNASTGWLAAMNAAARPKVCTRSRICP